MSSSSEIIPIFTENSSPRESRIFFFFPPIHCYVSPSLQYSF
jgi:hypothetical protein